MSEILKKVREKNPAFRHYSDEYLIGVISRRTGKSIDEIAGKVGYTLPEPEPEPLKEGSRPSGFGGLLRNVVRGTEQTGRNIGAMTNTLTGDLATVEDYARRSQESSEKDMPVEQRQLHSELHDIDREQGAMGQIGDTLSAAARNPMGTAQLITEQLPNSAVSLGSGWAGFKAGAAMGAAAGPVGAGIGGTLGFLGGMFLGNYMLEGGARSIEKADGGFTPDERGQVLEETPKKAGVITAIDAATMKMGGMLANRLGGAAAVKSGARAEADVLMKAGVDMSSPASINAALAKNPALMKEAKKAGERAAINAISNSKKAGIAGTGLALETVGEGAGEYLGELAATGEADVVDATIEALAGFSQSAAITAYNYNRIGNKLNPENIRRQASAINQAKTQEGINNIANAGSVDEAIQAATETASQRPVTPDDVLDDIAYKEDLLKRTEQFTQQGAINEETQQEAHAQSEQGTEVLTQPEGLGQQGRDIINRLASEINPLTEAEITQGQDEGAPSALFNRQAAARDTAITLPDNTSLSAQWDVVDADSVQASIKEGKNQPRDRTRAASDAQIAGIANSPNYSLVSDSPVMDVGAPVISHDGAIVAGNGRFEGLSRSYNQGTANQYREQLRADAARKGIDPAVIDGMSKPVLVRRITQPFDTRRLAIKSNSGMGLQYSALELARIDSERMRNLGDIEILDNGDIALTQHNNQKLRDALGDYDATELGALIDKDGALSQDGVRRVKSAILYSAYGDSPTLSRLIESTDNDIRNITGALTKVAGDVARVRNDIKQGAIPEELDITNDLIDATEKIAQLKAQNMPVDAYLAQQGLFGDDISSSAREFVQYLSDNIRSQKKMVALIKAVYDGLGSIDTTTADIFGETQLPSKQEIFSHARKQVNPEQEQQSIFTDNQSATEGQARQADSGSAAERSQQGKADERLTPVSKRKKKSADDIEFDSETIKRDLREISELNNIRFAENGLPEAKLINKIRNKKLREFYSTPEGAKRLQQIVLFAGYNDPEIYDLPFSDNSEHRKIASALAGTGFLAEEMRGDGDVSIVTDVASAIKDMTGSTQKASSDLSKGIKDFLGKNDYQTASRFLSGLFYAANSVTDTESTPDANTLLEQASAFANKDQKDSRLVPASKRKQEEGVFDGVHVGEKIENSYARDTGAKDGLSLKPMLAQYKKLFDRLTGDDFLRSIDIKEFHEIHDKLEEIRNDVAGLLESGKISAIDADGKKLLSRNTGSKNEWRITYFSEDGQPSGHSEYTTAKSAVNDLFVSRQVNENWNAIEAKKQHYNPNQMLLDFGRINVDYGDIEQRPGTKEKQRELGRNAFRELLERAARRGQGSLLGAAIARDFKEHAGATLIGQTVRSSEDLAILAQVLRDPRYETFRIFFTKGNQIVHHSGVTSRLPSASRIYSKLPGETEKQAQDRFVATVKNQMQQTEADGYYVLHNHPSGKAEPSIADIKLTEFLNKAIPGFKNHVIIDHNEYGVISMGDNDTTTISEVVQKELTGGYSNNNPAIPHNALRKVIDGPASLAELGKTIERKEGYFTLIGLGVRLDVVSIAEFPVDILKKPDIYLLGALRRFARHSGADSVAAVADRKDDIRKLDHAAVDGVLLDVVEANTGKGLGAGGRKLFDIGKASSRAMEVREFAGENAETADRMSLSRAKEMLAEGLDEESIRQETGWHKGVDGKWRFEIDDSDAKLKKPFPSKGQMWGDVYESVFEHRAKNGDVGLSLGDVIEHPALFAAYPHLASLAVSTKDGHGATYQKSSNDPPSIKLGRDVVMHDVLSIILHEVQHAIQDKEGFASGGNPNFAADELAYRRYELEQLEGKIRRLDSRAGDEASFLISKAEDDKSVSEYVEKAWSELKDKLGEKSESNPYGATKKLAVQFKLLEDDEVYQNAVEKYNRLFKYKHMNAYDVYKHYAGEIEARNTQTRQKQSKEDRKLISPNETQDINNKDAIVIYNGKIMESSPDPANIKQSANKNLFVGHNITADNIRHAIEIGGLAAPSLAIAKTDHNFTGYGEITLLANPSILESEKVRAFDADIYSPRHPRALFDIDQNKYRNFVDELGDVNGLDIPGIDELEERSGQEAFTRSAGIQYAWLKSQGKEPPIKKLKVPKEVKALSDAMKDEGIKHDFMVDGSEKAKAVIDAHVSNTLKEYEKLKLLPDDRKESFARTLKRDLISRALRYNESNGMDVTQLSHDVQKKFRNEKTAKDFRAYALTKFNQIISGKKLLKGFTPSGNRKYVPYNMENILKEMTKELRAGEGFNYGAGSMRSAYTKELKNLKEIQRNRDRIISSEEFKKIKEESQDKVMSALEELKPYYKYNSDGFHYYDDASSAITEGESGIRQAFNLDSESRAIIKNLTDYLRSLPTEYFEAKAQRAVSFNEFAVAVVPKGTDKDVIDALKQSGLKIKYYEKGNNESRRQAVAEAGEKEKILFSTPAWHGSPHDHDRFSMDKIGSGEGAQAYGYGLYFTDTKEIAEFYKDNVKDLAKIRELNNEMSSLVKVMNKYETSYRKYSNQEGYDAAKRYDELMHERDALVSQKGKIYQVELAPEQDEYLLWDKPLSEQSEKIKDALSKGQFELQLDSEMSGKDIYLNVALDTSRGFENAGYEGASNYLHSLGIRGIKYLDGSSRSKGDGAYNYVIFDDKDISIVNKYSRSKKQRGISAEEIKKAVNPLKARLGNGIKINVVDSINDVPNEIHLLSEDGKIPSDTDGLYDPNSKTVYLIADNIPSQDRAVWVALHETVGHAGLRSLGKDVRDTVAYASKNKFVSDLGKAIAKDRQEQYDALHHNEEAIAELSAALLSGNINEILDRYGIAVPKNAQRNLESIIQRVIEAIRRFASSMMGKVTDQQIRELVMAAKVAVEGGRIESSDAANDYIKESLRLIRNGYRTVNDFIIPETPEYADNFTGDLAYVPENGKVPSAPLRIEVGVASGTHQGFGVMHLADNAKKDSRRKPESITGDLAEDLMREAILVMRGAKDIRKHEKSYVFVNHGMRKSVVAKFTGAYYSITTVRPYNGNPTSLWGMPEWTGRLAFPVRDTLAASPSSSSRQDSNTPSPDRIGLEDSDALDDITREKFTIPEQNEKGQDKKRPVVTTKKKKSFDDPNFSIMQSRERLGLQEDFNESRYRRSIIDWAKKKWGNKKSPDDSLVWKNFVQWFGDSKVVDGDGHPVVVSHYTDVEVIDQFNRDMLGSNTSTNTDQEQAIKMAKIGFWFSDTDIRYTPERGRGMIADYKHDFYLAINNPMIFDSFDEMWSESDFYDDHNDWLDSLKGLGYDGVIIKDDNELGGTSFVALDNTQIKSANENIGSFSSKDDSVRFSRASSLSNAGVNTTATQAGKAINTLPEETKLQSFRRKTQDAMLRFKVLQNWLTEQGINLTEAANVYQRENISKGKTANKIEDFRKKQLEPIIKDIAEAKFDLSDIVTYLEARHIPEANARMRQIHNDPNATANGIADNQAQKVLADFQSMPNFKEFEQLANRVRAIGAETLEMRHKAGLISDELYDAYTNTYKEWVPLRGNMKPEGFGKGLSTGVNNKRRMGHGFREDEFILENLIQDRERAIMQIEKNKVGMSVLEFLMQANNPDIGTVGKPIKRAAIKDHSYAVEYKGQVVGSFENKGAADSAVLKILNGSSNLQLPGVGMNISPQDLKVIKTYDPHVVMMARPQLEENEIQVYINGSAVKMQLNDPLLARAATAAGIEQVGGILEAARAFNRFLSKAYTSLSPDFFLTNMFRDAYSGSLVLTGKQGGEFTAKVFRNYAPAFRDLWKARKDPAKSQWVTRYRNAGGNIGAAWLPDLDRVGRDAIAALHEFAGARQTYNMVYSEQKANGASDSKARTMALLKAGKAKASATPVIGNLFEMVERVNATIENTLRLATFRTAIESGLSDQQAAMLSKDLMNFNRKGEQTSQLGALYLFFNPAAQSAHITAEALFTSPHKKQVWSLLAAMTTLSFLLAELGRGDDEDEWDGIPEHVKDRNLVFKFGDMQATIPVAYGWGFAHTFGRLVSDFLHGEDMDKISVKLAASFVDNFSPAGNPIATGDHDTNISAFQLLPTIPKIVVGPSVNMNSFGNEIYPHKYNESLPDSQLANRSVRGTIYQSLADFLNDATGGSKYEPGAISISPDTIKFWVTSLAGGAGRFVSDIFTGAMDAASGVAPDLENVPVARRFVRESGVKDSRSAFWKAKKEAQAAAERFNRAVKDGEVYYAQESFDKHGDLIALAKFADANAKMAAKFRDAVLEIQLSEDLTKSEKKTRIKELEIQEKAVYDEFLGAFREIKK